MYSSLFSTWRFRVLASLLAVVGAGAAFFLTASMAFAADTISSSTYRDLDPINGNGTVDTIRWALDENVTACTYEAGDWTIPTAGTINVTAITSISCTGADANLNIAVTVTAGITGGVTDPTITYTNQGTTGSVTLTSGAMTNKVAQAATDGAAPQLKTLTYQDTDTDAKIDRFSLAFTETLSGAGTSLAQNNLLLTSAGDFTGLAFTSAAGDVTPVDTSNFTLAVTESSAEDTASGAALTLSTTGTFSIQDATGNADSTARALTHVTIIDGASPILISSTPASLSASALNTSDIVLTFSEPIDVASDTITLSPSVSYTETWSSGNSVLTLDGAFAAGRTTITFTAAPDAASPANSFGGAQSGDSTVASPLVFNIAAPSSDSTTSDTEDVEVPYEVSVLSPNGAEEYMPGDLVNITWDATGPSAIGGININFVYEQDGSTYQTTVVSATANDGSYTWTVPDVDTDSATIQVTATDLVDTLAMDSSDEYFTVGYPSSEDDGSEPSDEVTTPSTGETGVSPVTGEMEEISEVEAGMYIRSSYFSTVYYIEQNASGALVRRPFTDAQTFMTWQNNWSRVETVTDATLPTMALGSPMLPKSGVVLVKIQSNAKVYVVEGSNTLRWLSDEDVAIDTYGSDWADYVIDVPVTLFSRFEMGEDVDSVEEVNMGMMKTRAEVNS